MKAQLALRMKYRLAAVRKRHYVPHSSGARARAKFQFIAQNGGFINHVASVSHKTVVRHLIISTF